VTLSLPDALMSKRMKRRGKRRQSRRLACIERFGANSFVNWKLLAEHPFVTVKAHLGSPSRRMFVNPHRKRIATRPRPKAD
jgi:hypothetical protein